MNTESTTPDVLLQEPIKKTFKKENQNYTIIFSTYSEDSNKVVLQVFREFDQYFWEKIFSFDTLMKESTIWGAYMNTRNIIDLLFEQIENTIIEIFNQHLCITLKSERNIFGSTKDPIKLVLKCDAKEIDINKSVNSLSDTVKEIKKDLELAKAQLISVETNIKEIHVPYENLEKTIDGVMAKVDSHENSLNEFKILIESRDNSLNKVNKELSEKLNEVNISLETFSRKIKQYENITEENSKRIEQYENKTEENCKRIDEENKKAKEICKRIDEDKKKTEEICKRIDEDKKKTEEICKRIDEDKKKTEVNCKRIDEDKLIIEKLIKEISDINSSLPKEVLINSTINEFEKSYFQVTNNKTIKKIGNSGGWDGVYLKDKIVFDGTIKEHSIKIDTINTSGHLMLGFALPGLNKAGGLFAKANSWLLYLNNGIYYISSSAANYLAYINCQPVNGDTVSICLDTANCLIYAKLNGKVCSSTRRIVLDESQKTNLYPCFDMFASNDQITLISNK